MTSFFSWSMFLKTKTFHLTTDIKFYQIIYLFTKYLIICGGLKHGFIFGEVFVHWISTKVESDFQISVKITLTRVLLFVSNNDSMHHQRLGSFSRAAHKVLSCSCPLLVLGILEDYIPIH